MRANDRRVCALMGLVFLHVVVRQSAGFLDRGLLGGVLGMAVILVGAGPLAFRLARRLRRRTTQAPKATAEPGFGPYRSSAGNVLETPARKVFGAFAGDVVCLVRALAVWAELRSPEPLQRLVLSKEREAPCVVAPCGPR